MVLFESFKQKLKESWHHESPRRLFNVLIAFLITYTIAHLYSLFVPFYVFIAGYHIHHFYYGILILTITSIAAILTNVDKVKNFLSYFIGIGIGLIVDELSLLLSCTGGRVDVTCSYHFPNTFDFVLIISTVLLIFIFFGDKPIRWFLPKSWRNHPTLNANLGDHVKKVREWVVKSKDNAEDNQDN